MLTMKELFDVEVGVKFNVGENNTLTFFFRNATTEEEYEFRRRAGRSRLENGVFEPTEASLKATMYLYSKCLKRVLHSNGSGESEEVAPEEQKNIPEQIKVEAISAHRLRIRREEGEQLQD